jgi:hypothetical protein
VLVIEMRVAAVTLQATPPTVTCTSESVAENADPAIVTVVPEGVVLVIWGVRLEA